MRNITFYLFICLFIYLFIYFFSYLSIPGDYSMTGFKVSDSVKEIKLK